jgi:rhodanese-related sulfurtransferase
VIPSGDKFIFQGDDGFDLLNTVAQRVGDAGHAQRPILICCATGNRSTVAAKILIDRGVQRVYNLRPGIAGWERENLPVVR